MVSIGEECMVVMQDSPYMGEVLGGVEGGSDADGDTWSPYLVLIHPTQIHRAHQLTLLYLDYPSACLI